MLYWLIKIPGPDFLFGYIILCFFSLLACWNLLRGPNDDSPLPDKNSFNPIAFAALRGGWKTAVDTAVVQLMEREIIGIEEISGKKCITIKTETSDLSPLEKVIYDYVSTPRERVQFSGKPFQDAVENALQPIYQELEEQGLRKSKTCYSRNKMALWFSLLFWDGIAIIKAILGLTYNKPIGFLILAIIIVTIVHLVFFCLNDWITRLGYRYIKDVQNQFSWLKDDLKNGSSLINYVLGVAILGVSVLAFNEIFRDYQTFAQSNIANSSGYDGGTSGSDGGGDSSGGCSGGGGCGGGCGGCGGGD
ncbi:MAG: hypothetical protein H6Q73_2288 [Firmicutes bacterium]|nr:hypothetical protein [Bacillota bacterium]